MNLRSLAEQRVGRKMGALRVMNSYWVRLIAVPTSAASLNSPYDRCAPLRSSSWVSSPSVVWLHATGQLLSPAMRCLSISTVHGGAGGGGAEGEPEAATITGSHCGGHATS